MLIAIDPGKTIGYVVVIDPFHLIEMGEAQSMAELRQVLEKHNPNIIVIESFSLYPWKAQAQSFSKMPSPEIIGNVKEWATLNLIDVVEQTPSQRTVITDTLLKATNWWELTKGKRHARDAVRHMLCYYMRNDKMVAEKLWHSMKSR